MKGDNVVGKNLPKAVEDPKSSNHFVVLSTLEVPILEEGELQQFKCNLMTLKLIQDLWNKLEQLNWSYLV